MAEHTLDREELAALILAAIAEGPASPKVVPAEANVTTLPLGATARVPAGYDTEAKYLASQRESNPMRLHGSDRHSHRRWSPPVTTIGRLLEGAAARFGDADAIRQRARANAARFWYGCPRISLG